MSDVPGWARRGRASWSNTGAVRPPFALDPGPGQESVWDYPRPPRLEPERRVVVVRLGDVEIARSTAAQRVLETSHPPTVYVPWSDVRRDLLVATPTNSRCEWKGAAREWAVHLGDRSVDRAAWSYPDPFPEFESIRDHVAFHPARLECVLGGIPVVPQAGGFYGGWITPEVLGPFKGEPSTAGW